MLEKLLQDVIAALNANTAATNAATAALGVKPAAAAPAVAVPAAVSAAAAATLTLEQMQGKLKELMEKKGKDTVVKIFGELGAKKLSDVPATRYAELDAKIAAALAAAEQLF